MNLSTAIFLVNDTVRSVRVEYEPDVKNNPVQLFKTLDPALKVGDFVIVPTETRHKMTVVKVVDIDFGVDFDSAIEYRWVIGKIDKSAYDAVLERETSVIEKVRSAETNRKRKELAAALHINDIDFGDNNLLTASPEIPKEATIKG